MAWGPKGSLLPGKEKEDRDPLALKTACVLAVTTRACAVALCVKCPQNSPARGLFFKLVMPVDRALGSD